MEQEKEQYITSSLYTFENMRNGNYLYVDKTEYLWRLIRQPRSMFFFSRPRRFGKSLTISTLKAIFQGKKELFKDLYIENRPYDWKAYPVIHLDMGSDSADTPERLEYNLLERIKDIANDFGLTFECKYSSEAFEKLIKKLHDRDGEVVVLIDEYDKPILNNIENEKIEEFHKIMKGFYSVLKTCEPYERFVFITGVGKFLKVSIFSDLNNLSDISVSDDYATLCGYTKQEIEDNFQKYLTKIVESKNIKYEILLEKIKDWYDGYKFSENCENVYNPVSFTKFIENSGKLKNYWFETGSPSILVKLIKNNQINIEETIADTYKEDIFTAFMPSHISFIALMYQTGYLTIKETNIIDDITLYKLGFPNYEVEQSFYQRLITNASIEETVSASLYLKLINALRNNDVDRMMETVNSFVASIPYNINIKSEKYYQTIFYAMFRLVGYSIHTEVCTNRGRIDAVIENGNKVYIFEFKLNQTKEAAFDQIMEREYYKAYQHSGKKITLIGANYKFTAKKKPFKWKKIELE